MAQPLRLLYSQAEQHQRDGPINLLLVRKDALMPATSFTLLDRLQNPQDTEAWQLLEKIYKPVLRNWLRHHALQPSDHDDITQEIFLVVCKRLADFRHNHRPGAFRTWLRTIAHNRLQHFWRDGRYRPGAGDFEKYLEQLEDPSSALSAEWNRQHDLHVLRQLLEVIQPDFHLPTWQAFHQVVLGKQPPAQVARDLGMSLNAVLIAKSRVLQRLRQEAQGLID
jgi:RNA polymerase sigma-70 factor (ECF subfamily)